MDCISIILLSVLLGAPFAQANSTTAATTTTGANTSAISTTTTALVNITTALNATVAATTTAVVNKTAAANTTAAATTTAEVITAQKLPNTTAKVTTTAVANTTREATITAASNTTAVANATAAVPKTTTPELTTAAATTTKMPTTTMSPAEKDKIWCESYFAFWEPNNTACIRNEQIDNECVEREMYISSEYLRCKSVLKYEISHKIAKYDSMFFLEHLKFFGHMMINQFLLEKETNLALQFQTERDMNLVFSNMIWITGFQFRYADVSWPNYHKSHKYFKRKKWNKRNCSIIAQYGALPRGTYKYRFALYDSLWTGPLTRGLVRLKRKWPKRHEIFHGEYVSYDKETDLYFKKTQSVNSPILQLYVEPVPQNPLPAKLVFALNHLNRNMEKPLCVYWQTVEDYSPEIVPTSGYWSNYGMEVESTNKTMTICSAYHYGAFALFMEPILPTVEKPMTTFDIVAILLTLLAMLMIIGYVVSMAMLECYQSTQCRMFIYIAISMFFADLFFFLGIFTRSDFNTCTNLMTLYELAFMFVVTWFMMDSIHQLNMLTPLFNPKTCADSFYVIVGIGLPLAVLIAMLEFPYPEFKELTYCWPNVDGAAYLYFIGPLGVVIIVTTVLRMLTYEKVREADKTRLEDINYMRAFSGTKSTGLIVVTCILYWIIGAAGIKATQKSGEVVMVILSAIQVIISGEIIYYYFRQNDEVADALEQQKKILERMRMNKMDHLAGICMDVKYVPGQGDSLDNLQMESNVDLKDDVDKDSTRFDSMFGSNLISIDSSSPDSDTDLRMGDFASQTSLIRVKEK